MSRIFTTRSFFVKLLVTYLLIIFITLSVLGLLLGQLYQSYIYSEKEDALTTQGKEINNLVTSFLSGELSNLRFNDQLAAIDRISKDQIWIVDNQGMVYRVSTSSKDNVQGSKLDKNQYKKLLQGQIVINITEDKNHFDSKMMSVGVPLKFNGQVQGATLLHTSIVGIQQSLINVYWFIAKAALVSILLAFILIYFISKKISVPIHEMNKVSLAMVGGDFTKTVPVTSNDEVGQLATTFNYMVSELGKLEQMRKDFIANVSHELRSPLTSIRGFIQGVLDGTITPEEQNKYLNIAFEETNRLSRLVNDLLDLTRMEAGNFELDIQTFELNGFIKNAITKLEPQSTAKEINISDDIPANTKVMADKDKIEQVLINLLDNAIRFSYPQSAIKIAAHIEKNKVLISITDFGVGIPQDEITNIWDRFYKCDKARTRSKGGTGLGLAIIKQIIKAHNEEIQVASAIGQGTVFTFSLPVAKI